MNRGNKEKFDAVKFLTAEYFHYFHTLGVTFWNPESPKDPQAKKQHA
jgi:hypothetical protein